MESAIAILFHLAILIFSVVIHEVSHGLAANALGDPTAKYAGRLTLNPMSHLSFFGMVIFPVFSYLAWGIPVGAAKPVPYNPDYLRNQKWGAAIVAAAGPAANLALAAVLGTITRLLVTLSMPAAFTAADFVSILIGVAAINVWLAVVNLVPIPPIDGSKIVFPFLPHAVQRQLRLWGFQLRPFLAQYWLILLVLFIFVGRQILVVLFSVISPVARTLFVLFTGQPPPF